MTLALVSIGAVTLAACSDGGSATSSTPAVTGSGPSAATVPPQTPNSGGQATSTPTRAATPGSSTGPDMGETHVRFTVGDAEIIVRIADNPTSRDFVSMLPLSLAFEDFAAMEKLSYLPRRLTTQGSTGRAPANGDLIYFVPWGNLGFFYNAERRDRSFDDRVIPIGTVEAGSERLDDLERGPVRVERIR